jgi:hypothetical protein
MLVAVVVGSGSETHFAREKFYPCSNFKAFSTQSNNRSCQRLKPKVPCVKPPKLGLFLVRRLGSVDCVTVS